MRRAIIVVLACSLLLPAGLLATSAAADPVDVPGLEGPAMSPKRLTRPWASMVLSMTLPWLVVREHRARAR